MRFQRALWSVDMPEGWTYQEAGRSVAFFNPDGVGAFNVSAYQKGEPVTDSDLREFANSARLDTVSAGNASGFACKLLQGDKCWLKWWLRSASVMVHVTYNCNVEDQGTEQKQIDHFISSVEIASP
jgi:hypothetical protein